MIYWKFSRSGNTSRSYVSLIFDIGEDLFDQFDNLSLNITFDQIKMMLVLLQDVEVLNNPDSWYVKPALLKEVNKINYNLSSNYKPSRDAFGLVKGKEKIGVHSGTPLDYGFIKNTGQLSKISIKNLQVSFVLDASLEQKKSFDKLKAYRGFSTFKGAIKYYDLMPRHNVIPELYSMMLNINKNETARFVEDTLKWERII